MRIWLIIIVLGLSLTTQAQNKKNEIRIGVPGAYFFEKSIYRIHNLKSVPIPTYLSYSRKINNKISISANYCFYWLGGDQKDLIYNGLTLSRHFDVINTLVNYEFYRVDKISISSFYGLSFRFSGGELFHVRYIDHGAWREEFLDYRAYNDFGLSVGTQMKYNFYKRFSIGGEIDYTKYFTPISPNQLSTAMFIEYEF